MSARSKSNHDELIRRANRALEEEEFEQAEAFARRALMLAPDSADARGVLASALIEQARYEEAVPILQELMAIDPEDVISLADLGLCLFVMCEFEEAEVALSRALELVPNDPQASFWMGLCVERRGQYQLADELFRQAHSGDAEAYPVPTRLSRREFQAVVEEALAALPDRYRRQLNNLTIIVDDLPREEDITEFDPPLDPCLFGLYVGVPLPERSVGDPPRLPDTIYIYQRNLERVCEDHPMLLEEIRITLMHEIGHFLGLDEQELEESGYA